MFLSDTRSWDGGKALFLRVLRLPTWRRLFRTKITHTTLFQARTQDFDGTVEEFQYLEPNTLWLPEPEKVSHRGRGSVSVGPPSH